MVLFAFIKPIWSCDPASGNPSELYPQDQSVDIALDTHILLKMVHMVSDYVPYDIVLRKETETGLEEINGTSSVECIDTIGWDGICWVRFIPDENLETNQNYMVSIEGEYDYMTEMQSSFTTGDSLISDVQSEVLAPTLEYLDQEFIPYDNFCGTPAEYRWNTNVSGLNPSNPNQEFVYLYQSDEDGQNATVRKSRSMIAESHNMHLDVPESTGGEGCFFAEIRNSKNESIVHSQVLCTPINDASTPTEDTGEKEINEGTESGCTNVVASPTETLILSTILLLFNRRRR